MVIGLDTLVSGLDILGMNVEFIIVDKNYLNVIITWRRWSLGTCGLSRSGESCNN